MGREGKSVEVNSELIEREAILALRGNCIKRWRWLQMREVDRNEETGRERRRDSSGD